MELIVVENKKHWRLFHSVLDQVYHQDRNYIYPLRGQIQETFDPVHNKPAATGQHRCFVLLDDRQKAVGRIAAFIDPAQSPAPDRPKLGGIGFFECIDQAICARRLFDVATSFLREQGVGIVEGPVNFGERDRYWGLLVKGSAPPLYQENYHPAYYQDLFLENGFYPFEQILTFKGSTADIPFDRLKAIAKRLHKRYPVEVRPLDLNEIDEFAEGFAAVYNGAFRKYDHFKPIEPDQIASFVRQARMIVDPQLACIAYYDGQPAGFIALYPDINPYLRHARGKLSWWRIPIFLLQNRLAKQKIAKGMGFGIHPDFQSKGIFALLVDYLCSPRNLKLYPDMYLAQIRTHNHEIRSMYDKLGVKVDRVHVTYRKALLDGIRIEPFEFIDI